MDPKSERYNDWWLTLTKEEQLNLCHWVYCHSISPVEELDFKDPANQKQLLRGLKKYKCDIGCGEFWLSSEEAKYINGPIWNFETINIINNDNKSN